ncbi:MAG: RloB family protein [Bacteroidia bacterium]|nr:RloB family protein [Bacteroidia bacterium]
MKKHKKPLSKRANIPGVPQGKNVVKRYIIYADKSEIRYMKELLNYAESIQDSNSANVKVQFKETQGGSPDINVQDILRKIRFDRIGNDDATIICVCDQDQYTPEQFARAQAEAAEHGILLCVSSPCFELFLVLHFQEVTAPADFRWCERKLERYLGEPYQKADPKIFEKIRAAGGSAGDAVRRARRMAAQTDPASRFTANPYTELHLLVELLADSADL